MRAVMFSINKPHTDNIVSGIKTIELRTKPPKIEDTYKAYIYETSKSGGCGKVIGEFTAYNEATYRICMGVPKHLIIEGCLSGDEIWKYADNGKKDVTAISITDIIRYDKPKGLNEFHRKCEQMACEGCEHLKYQRVNNSEYDYECEFFQYEIPITRPPQNWCYVENLEG